MSEFDRVGPVNFENECTSGERSDSEIISEREREREREKQKDTEERVE